MNHPMNDEVREYALRVLLVEDNPRYAGLLQEELGTLGEPLQIVHRDRLRSAADYLRQGQTVDAVLLDLMLPDGSGLATLDAAAAIAGHLPIIVLTGSDDEAMGIEAIAKGAQDYLVKSQINPRRLLQNIRHAIQRKRLEEELKTLNHTLEHRVAERTAAIEMLLEHLLSIADDARRGIAGELHDDVGQELTGLGLKAETLVEMLARDCVRHAAGLAADVATSLRRTQEKVRKLCHGIMPSGLEEGLLADALRRLAAETSPGSGIQCAFSCSHPDLAFDSRVSIQLYRIAQEAVSNAVRHSGGQKVCIRLEECNGRTVLVIEDDGKGLPNEPTRAEGMGRRTMRYRAGLIGGRLELGPGRCGGTRVECRLAAAADCMTV